MPPYSEITVTVAVLGLLSIMSIRSFLFWQHQPGVRRLPVRPLEAGIGSTIFLLLTVSIIFFDDGYSRPAVALISAGTYYTFARLCASMGSSVWSHKRFHSVALVCLLFFALALTATALSTPLIVLAFSAVTYWEQWRFTDALSRESCAELASLRTKMRTIKANLHNNSITKDVEDDNLDVAG